MTVGRAIITEARAADADHRVLTVTGGNGSYRREPCSDCPWRVDAAGIFPAEAFRLAGNVAIDGSKMREIGDALHAFACHQSGAGKPATCAGYILRGQDGIGWRIAAATGRFDPREVTDQGLTMHDSYFDMAVANGVVADDPALDACRPWDWGHDHG